MMNQPGVQSTDFGDILANIHEMRWHDVGGGTAFKVLRADVKTNEWVLYVHMAPGARFQGHRHLGNGAFFVTKGELKYEVGTAPAGTYGFEPVFSEHFAAGCDVETEMLFMGQGAVAYFKDDNETIDFVFDAETLVGLVEGATTFDVAPKAAQTA